MADISIKSTAVSPPNLKTPEPAKIEVDTGPLSNSMKRHQTESLTGPVSPNSVPPTSKKTKPADKEDFIKLDFEVKGNTEEQLLKNFPRQQEDFSTTIIFKEFNENHGHIFIETNNPATLEKLQKEFRFDVNLNRDHNDNGEDLKAWTPPPKRRLF